MSKNIILKYFRRLRGQFADHPASLTDNYAFSEDPVEHTNIMILCFKIITNILPYEYLCFHLDFHLHIYVYICNVFFRMNSGF